MRTNRIFSWERCAPNRRALDARCSLNELHEDVSNNVRAPAMHHLELRSMYSEDLHSVSMNGATSTNQPRKEGNPVFYQSSASKHTLKV